MKAAILEKYASDGRELIVRDIPIPAITDDEVLVKVMAAAVNPLDNMIVRGEVKLIVPYRFPLVMGNELSGVVEKVGSGVKDFQKGDRVYARMPLDKIGAFAEYAAKRNQKYHFIFVHEDGEGLKNISAIFAEKQVQTSLDEVFSLDDINKAMKKVASGRSRGKTIIKIA